MVFHKDGEMADYIWRKKHSLIGLKRGGAHWRSHAAEDDLEQQEWDIDTYNHWLEVIKQEGDEFNEESSSGLGVSLETPRCYPMYLLIVLLLEPMSSTC